MKVTVTFNLDIKKEVSPEDLEQWVRFELHETGSIPMSNQLSDTELEAEFGSVVIEY